MMDTARGHFLAKEELQRQPDYALSPNRDER